jgi:hypothetical protein
MLGRVACEAITCTIIYMDWTSLQTERATSFSLIFTHQLVANAVHTRLSPLFLLCVSRESKNQKQILTAQKWFPEGQSCYARLSMWKH